ncbi:MAG: hypothetical protein JW730_09520 [Anaerolineales bacterium]|nr:hypothetical protein [Anaerolineales bacterium]
MRRLLFVIALLALIVTACTSAAPTEGPSLIIKRPTSTPIPKEPIPTPKRSPAGLAEEAVVERLAANLGLQESDISVLSSELVEFRDSCLGMVLEDVPCAQVITPGYTVVLEANGLQYEYRTSRDGKRIQPATLALVWKREGGIVGFCDTLTVFLSGEVYASQCRPQAEGRTGTFADLLSSQEQKQFNNWIAKFAETHLDASDPKGVSDRMVVTLELYGTGNKPPTQSEQQALFKFAQELYQELAR